MREIELIGNLVTQNLSDTKALIQQLTAEQYRKPLPVLSGSSVGQHFRHVIEFYTCLLNQIESGIICYDNRGRDARIEAEPEFAVACIGPVISFLNALKEDKRLYIRLNLSAEEDGATVVESSLGRELAYNMEHSIHHQALIRIGLSQFTGITIDDNFGVAPSTILYKNTSVTT